MFECLLKRKMKGLGRKVANIVSKADDKKYSLLFFCSFGTCSTHTHQHAQLKERCAVQNSRKTELLSDSFLFPPSPREDFLTIQFLKEGTSICKYLAGSSNAVLTTRLLHGTGHLTVTYVAA